MSKAIPSEASQSEWQALYQAADAIYAQKPWEWMYDGDIVGVRDPETGQIGYCCVMGNLGEHYAVAVYLGEEGLDGWRRIAEGEFQDNQIDALFIQLCLMASFENREYLEKQDRDQIKALGRKYRGVHAWPMFRNYSPGYAPWKLTGPEVRFLTLALEQVQIVAEQSANDPSLFEPPADDQFLVRLLEDGQWRNIWHKPVRPAAAAPVVVPLNEVQIQRVKQRRLQHSGAWEADAIYMPQAIQEQRNQRPYYPIMVLVVDAASGMVLPPELGSDGQPEHALVTHLFSLFEQAPHLPSQIVVRNEALRQTLKPHLEPLTIRIRVNQSLPALDDARMSLLEALQGGLV